RRAVLSSLLMGPVFGPALFAVALTATVSITAGQFEKPLELPIVGADHAPNLVAWLEQRDVVVRDAPDDPEQAVRDGDHDVVLVIPPGYGEQFIAGTPASVQLIVDRSNRKAQANFSRARALVDTYGESIGRLRLIARGVS